MKKILIVFGLIGLAFLVSMGFVGAFGLSNNNMNFRPNGMTGHSFNKNNMMEHHEEMEKIMEFGSFQDLVDLRKKIGFNIMPWVNDETQFKEMQERHEQMEKMFQSGERGMMNKGFKAGKGIKFNCPMMDND